MRNVRNVFNICLVITVEYLRSLPSHSANLHSQCIRLKLKNRDAEIIAHEFALLLRSHTFVPEDRLGLTDTI